MSTVGAVAGLCGGITSGGVVWAGVASAAVTGASVAATVPCSPSAPGGGPAGLIAAIKRANAHGGGTINLAPGCTYALGPHADNPSDGLPIVTTPIAINGGGSTVARSHAAGTEDFRIFHVDGPGNLRLSSLTVTGGRAPGGGGILVDNRGTLTVDNSRVDQNTATAAMPGSKTFGGGISNDHSSLVTINTSRLDHNSASSANVAGGAGLYENNDSRSTLNASRVDHNSADAPDVVQGGGIAVDGGTGLRTVVLNSSQVDGNIIRTSATGAGVVAKGGGIGTNGRAVTLNGSRVTGNTADSPGGTASGGGILSLTIENQQPLADGIISVINSPVTGNTASGSSAGGGGISNQIGMAKVTSSQVNDNVVEATGAEPVVLSPSARGGGIENFHIDIPGVPRPSLTMTAAQLSGNRTTAPRNPAKGGGLFTSGSATLRFSSLTGNRANGSPGQGGGIFNARKPALVFTLVTGNIPDNCFLPGTIAGCTADVRSENQTYPGCFG